MDDRTRLEFGACAVELPDPSAICGKLTVPEDRADRESRLIGLPFAILPAVAPAAAKDPVVLFTGGPGPSPLRQLQAFAPEFLQQYPLRQHRDLIMMTHRGTDLTEPQSLDCPELIGEFSSRDQELAAAAACHARLVREGAKLAAYTAKAIARDAEDLRVLLGSQRGFTQWNLAGLSHGSNIALQAMRDAPQGIRSVVLDSPLPLQKRFFFGANVLDALSEITAACERDTACNSAFPQLRPRFAEAIERLEAQPVSLSGTTVSGHLLLKVLGTTLYQGPYASVPMFMDRVARSDLAGANALITIVGTDRLNVIPWGMYYSVACHDEGGLIPTPTDLPANGIGWPDRVRQIDAFHASFSGVEICPLWTAGQTLSLDDRKALRSDIPTLITVGQFDPATPVTNADMLLPDLSRAHKVVFPGRGHALLASDFCAMSVEAAYLDNPSQAPDTSCADRPDSLKFVTPP